MSEEALINNKKTFSNEVESRKQLVIDYLLQDKYTELFSPKNIPEDISLAVVGEIKDSENLWQSYIRRGGKSLRPAILLFSCGMVGGDEKSAIPAAAAIEVYHTFTLVHDDIMDRDDLRRKQKTVHEYLKDNYIAKGISIGEAQHYGISVAIIAGDLLHDWSKMLIDDLYTIYNIDAKIVLAVYRELAAYVTPTLASGQTKDIMFEKMPIENVKIDQIVDMLQEKTGILYEFAGRCGSMLGLETDDRNHEIVDSIAKITIDCGIAFQLQDDILGILGDSEVLGKPVDSDIKEKKRTTIVRFAWEAGDADVKKKLESMMNIDKELSDNEVLEIKNILINLGGIEKTKNLAKEYIKKAEKELDSLVEKNQETFSSDYVDLFKQWIDYMINRDF